MEFWSIFWDADDDPDGNVEHIAEHDLTKDDVEYVLMNPESQGVSQTTGLPVLWGDTSDGRFIIVVHEAVAKKHGARSHGIRGAAAEAEKEEMQW